VSSGSAPSIPATSFVPAGDPNGAIKVALILYPDSGPHAGLPGGGAEACLNKGAAGYDYRGCPVTSRLADRLDSDPLRQPGGGGSANPICRCQSTWQKVAVDVSPTASGAVVHVRLYGGSVVMEEFDLVILKNETAWVADDIRCLGGDDSTSIYNHVLAPCGP